MNILVTIPKGVVRDSFLYPETIEKMYSMGSVTFNEKEGNYTTDELAEAIKGIDVVIIGWGTPRIDETVMANADSLKVIAHVAGSVSPYVSEAVYKNGVKVISGNEMFAESVAEGVIAYMLAALRRIPYYASELKNKRWQTTKDGKHINEGLLDRTVGIVSYGAISKYLIPMLQPFRVKIKIYSRSIDEELLKKYNMELVSLEEIFKTCDIITLQTALNPHTINMINAELLSMIKPGALFVNTARGKVVDEQALIRELRTGRFHAILDVYHREPLEINSGLFDLDNVILMPHQGGPTLDRRRYIGAWIVDNVEGFFNGKELEHQISWEKAQAMTM